jgi:hypothetical protein
MKQLMVLFFVLNVVIVNTPDDIQICTVSGTGDTQIVVCN